MGQIQLIGSFILLTLFAIAVTSYAIGFSNENNVAVDINNDEDISTINPALTNDVQTLKDQSNTSSSTFNALSIKSGDDTFEGGGIFKSFTAPFVAVKRVFALINTVFFGEGTGNGAFGIVLTALISFLTILGVLYGWKTWRGNPD